MKRIGGTQCCAIQSQIVTAEKTCARNVLMVKKIAPSKSLTSVVSYKQWEKVEVSSQSKDAETYKRICIITEDFQVIEVVEKFQEAFY